MGKTKFMTRLLSVLLAVLLAFSLFGCSEKDKPEETVEATDEESEDATDTEAVEEVKEPVELTVMWPDENVANDINRYLEYNEIYKEIVDQTKVTFEIVGMNEEKFNMLLAGGDLPDVVCTTDEATKKLVNAKMIHDLDPLLESNGKDILSYATYRLEDAREKFDGKLYYLTAQAHGPVVAPVYPMRMQIYPTMRWDYYKELGHPEIRSLDDWLNVLKQMVDNHPETENGRKVYAVGAWNDWGDLWCYNMTCGIVLGKVPLTGAAYCKNELDETLESNYLSSESSLWQTLLFMNKANRLGILHPETFTMKYQDYEAAMVRNELISSPAMWLVGKANAELKDKGAFYTCIPFDFGSVYGTVNPIVRDEDYKGSIGWNNKNWSITTNCEEPERSMDFLNFVFSKEGSRLITSGIEGVHWEIVDGKAQMKPEIMARRKAGGEEWEQTCLGSTKGGLSHICGAAGKEICDDGDPVNLLAEPSSYAELVNELEKDYCDYYDVIYPHEAFQKKAAEGKIEENIYSKNVNLPTIPDDIERINTKLLDYMTKRVPQCVLEPESDEEFEAEMNKVMDELIKLGAKESWEWAEKAWQEERQKKYN